MAILFAVLPYYLRDLWGIEMEAGGFAVLLFLTITIAKAAKYLL